MPGDSNGFLKSKPMSYNAPGLVKVIKSVVSGQIGLGAGQATYSPFLFVLPAAGGKFVGVF